jgi:hypothetical protein
LGGEQRAAAAALGAALRFGADLCGRSEELLSAFSLDVEGGVIRLAGGARAAHIITETVQRRLEYAAACLGLRAQISVA